MNRFLTLSTAALALAIAAPTAATAQSANEERGFPQAAERTGPEITRGGYVGTTSRSTEDRGYPQPASAELEVGAFTPLFRDTSEEGFDK